jgi:hypothetical protein
MACCWTPKRFAISRWLSPVRRIAKIFGMSDSVSFARALPAPDDDGEVNIGSFVGFIPVKRAQFRPISIRRTAVDVILNLLATRCRLISERRNSTISKTSRSVNTALWALAQD